MTTGAHPATVSPQRVLDFWFGGNGAVDPRWFNGGEAYDALIRREFGATVQAALRGELDGWAAPPRAAPEALALVLVLDQFTRNIHRATPLAFAGDARALALAQTLVADGRYRRLGLLERWFACLPFEHAEDPAQQAESLRLFNELHEEATATPLAPTLASALDYARRHADVVQRFGRFPHRNLILGRPDTPEEATFLQQPGSRF